MKQYSFENYLDYFYKSIEEIGNTLSEGSLLERITDALSGWACLGICPPVSPGQIIIYLKKNTLNNQSFNSNLFLSRPYCLSIFFFQASSKSISCEFAIQITANIISQSFCSMTQAHTRHQGRRGRLV